MSSSPFNAYLSATMLSSNGGCPTFTMAPLVSNHCASGRSSYIECWGTLHDAIAPIKDDSAALVTASHDGQCLWVSVRISMTSASYLTP